MPQNSDKNNAVNGSIDDLAKTLSKASKSGKNLGDTPSNLAERLAYKDDGSGSLIVDLGRIPLETSGKDGVSASDKIDSMQKKITDFDMKHSKRLYDRILKKPNPGIIRTELARSFVDKQFVPVKSKNHIKGAPDEYISVNSTGLLNPLLNAQKATMPILNAALVYSLLKSSIKKAEEEGGDTVKHSYSREELIQKVAKAINSNDGQEKIAENTIETKHSSSIDKTAKELCLKASEALKVAVEKIKESETNNEKLALENQKLYLEIVAKTRIDDSTKLASQMNDKGLIKKADIQSKIDELISMDEDSFVMFKDAVENIHSHSMEKEGVDSLLFIADTNNIKSRRTLADSINEAAGEI